MISSIDPMNEQADLPQVVISTSVDLPDGIPGPDALGICVSKALSRILGHLYPGNPHGRIEMGLTIVSDSGIQSLNLRHRGLDQPTDVLSFPLMDDPGVLNESYSESDGPPMMLGDIVMSTETIVRQAEKRGTPLIERFTECLVHGTLHLLGYLHDSDEPRKRMEALEDELIPHVIGIFQK